MMRSEVERAAARGGGACWRATFLMFASFWWPLAAGCGRVGYELETSVVADGGTAIVALDSSPQAPPQDPNDGSSSRETGVVNPPPGDGAAPAQPADAPTMSQADAPGSPSVEDMATASQDAGMGTGLVAHWAFDEGKGTSVSDVSGTGNHGTTANGTGWAAGVIGGAGSFDGIDDGVFVSASPSLSMTGALSISAWVQLRAASSSMQIMISRNFVADARGYTLRINSSPAQTAEFVISSDCTLVFSVTSAAPIPIGEWVHLVGVFEPSVALHLYRNGTLDSTVAAGVPASQCDNKQSLALGRRIPGSGVVNPLNGLLDEVRVYDRVLTATEVAQLHRLGK
jgi:hypothetical protein